MIYVFLAEGFEETEAIAPLDCLRRAKKTVRTVGIGGKVITGAHGIPVTADLTEDAVVLDSALEMVVLPGGMPGTLNLEKNPTVRKALEFCAKNGRKIGAICAAPSVPGKMGLLKGQRAVCFPGFEETLTGAQIADGKACISGNFITGKGAGAALDFGLALVESLCGKDFAAQLGRDLQYL